MTPHPLPLKFRSPAFHVCKVKKLVRNETHCKNSFYLNDSKVVCRAAVKCFLNHRDKVLLMLKHSNPSVPADHFFYMFQMDHHIFHL